MKLFDVNVLINAYREDATHHEPCRAVVEDAVASPEAFGVNSLVNSGFLRVVTHRRVFRTPSSLVDAIEFLKARATGNLIPNAYLAATAIESGCELVTTDRDFARFPDLTWVDLLTG